MPKVRICCFIPNRFFKMVNKQPLNHHIEDQKGVSDSKTVKMYSLITYLIYILRKTRVPKSNYISFPDFT